MAELSTALHVRGAARRRFLHESRDHLLNAAAETGEMAALRAFGSPREIAAAFDAEVAARRGVQSTLASVVGVLTTGGSTLALIHASSTDATAPGWLAVAFFVCAQIAGVAASLALVQAFALRRSTRPPAELALLSRRNGCALVAAGVTMFAAGAALPGQGSALELLAGPALVCAALVMVLRARSLARQLEGAGHAVVRPPLEDLATLSGLRFRVPPLDARRLLPLTMGVAAAGAFLWDRGEHATVDQALVTGAIEAIALAVSFFLLGPTLGLRRR